MICCKIVADYTNSGGKFADLLRGLSSLGDFLWDNCNLYFGNTNDEKVTRSKVSSILKKAGYEDFLIIEYDRDKEPHESDYINGWITDKVVAITYNLYELRSQELFRNVSKGLDMIDQEIDRLKEQAETKVEDSSEEGRVNGRKNKKPRKEARSS